MWRRPTAAEALAMKNDLEMRCAQVTTQLTERRRAYENTGFRDITVLRNIREEMETLVSRKSSLQSQIRNMDRVAGKQIGSKKLIALEEDPGWISWFSRLW